jgi:hypothetical protein
MRSTDFCHLNERACIRTACVPGSLRDFHRVDAATFRRNCSRNSGVLGSMRLTRGLGVFTAPENASADCNWTRAAVPLSSMTILGTFHGCRSVDVFFPRRPLQSSL